MARVGATDLAIVIFPEQTLSDAVTPTHLSTTHPRVGEGLAIVGCGNNCAVEKRGARIKRYGYNIVRRVEGGTIHFRGETLENSAEHAQGNCAGASFGDSGGPLFIKNKLVGVTSGGYVKEGKVHVYYVDLTSEQSRETLQRAIDQGAKIPE